MGKIKSSKPGPSSHVSAAPGDTSPRPGDPQLSPPGEILGRLTDGTPAAKPQRKPRAKTPHPIPPEDRKIISARLRGQTLDSISKITDLSISTVRSRLDKYKSIFKELDNVDLYSKGKDILFSAAEMELLKTLMDEGKLAEANLQQVAVAFDKIHHAGRLTRGESTANVATAHFTGPPAGRRFRDGG